MDLFRQLLFAGFSCVILGIAWFYLDDIVLISVLICLLPLITLWAFPICFVFILFSYFRLHEAFPILIPYRIPELLAIASLIGLSWKLWITPQAIYWHRLHSLLIFFSAWVSICIIFSTNRDLAFTRYTDVFIKILIMTFAISWLPTVGSQLQRTPFYLAICGGVISCITIYNRVNEIGLIEGTRVTISRDIGSILGDPNDLALILQIPLCFTFIYMFVGSFWWRLLSTAMSLLLISATLLTQSRGGMLSLIACTFMVIMVRSRYRFILLSSAISLFILLLFTTGLGDRLTKSDEENALGESAMGRIHAWGAAWRMAINNPLTGVGLNNFYNNYYRYSDFWDGKNHAVHSMWFEVLSETGFVGLFIFIYLLYAAILQSYRLAQQLQDTALHPLAQGIWIGFIALSVGRTFLTHAFTWPLYILLGLLTALERITKNQEILYDSSIKKNTEP